MKLFKRKNLMGLIYGIFVLLPFCAILSRVIYVQSNKNAYESYSGQNDIEYSHVENLTDFVIGNQYTFNNVIGTYTDSSTKNSGRVYYSNVSNIKSLNQGMVDNLQLGNSFIFYYSNQSISFYINENNTQLYNATINNTYTLSFDFVLENYSSNDLGNNFSFLVEKQENSNMYLDNVFEYSVNKFINENNFGKLDFFQWFSTLFLESNSVNNMYVHFVNWYMNYLLYVSLGYLIFSVLMWFVNFFRGLVEKSTELNL